MNQYINTFSNGINRDISNNKYPNTNLYWAQNFRLVSKEGLSTGALTNVNGNSRVLTLGSGSEKVEELCLIRDTLVIFISSPEGGKIYVWEHTPYDFETTSPILIYQNADLDFGLHQVRAVGRYENERVQKVYFTNGETFFKHLNIINPNWLGSTDTVNPKYTQISYDLDSLDLVSDVSFSNITTQIVSGGNLKAGKIQYAYQLYSKRGSESVFSPTSQLIHLTEYDENQSSRNYFGSEIGTSVNKSVLVTISNPDQLFTRLRLVALEYSVLYQIPSIRIVGEYNIENLSDITIADNGLSIGSLTLEEFRFIQNNLFPKSLDIKDDYLFGANIKQDYFDITDAEFDARAFRADSSNGIVVYNGNTQVNIPYPFTTLPNIETELFNPFNDISNDYTGDTATELLSYKYIPGSNGTKLGGKGLYIEYEFTTEQVVLDDAPRTNDWGDGYPRLNIDSSIPVENQANPQSKVGYQRDEIYRFGIVFLDKKGRPSFTKWIGDIRFPNNTEMPFIEYDTPNNRVLSNILGIKFTVDTSGIADKISGYQIVRAERTSNDKTIIAQGLVGHPIYTGIGEEGDIDHLYSLASQPLVRDFYYKYTSYNRRCETYLDISGSDAYEYDNKFIHLNTNYTQFDSPDVAINKTKLPITNSYLDVFGYLNNVENVAISGVRGFEDGSPGALNKRDILVADKPRDIGFANNRIKTNITNCRIFSPKSVGIGGDPNDDATKVIIDNGDIYNNQAYAPEGESGSNNKSKWGLRGTHLLLNSSELAITSDWLSSTDPIRFLIANYRVFRGRAIYGGTSYEARTYTKYYPVSEFVTSNTVDVFGGDTYISYFMYLRSIYDPEVRIEGYRIESYQFYPVESTINLQLRLDKMQNYINWGLYRDAGVTDYKLTESVNMGVSIYGNNYPSEVGNLYRYNSVYSAIDKSREFYSKPFDFEVSNTNDTMIVASEKKINGEYIDNWTKFKFNNYINVDSKHHGITKIITFKNNLYYFQPTAVGIASVNQRSLIQDNHIEALSVGTGGILTRYDYITDKSGSEFYEGIIATDDYLYYADGRRKRINKIIAGKEEAVSVIKGIDSLLNTLSFSNVRAGFDRGFNEAIFSIDGVTMAFNEPADAFVSSYTFSPGKMISIGGDFYSTAPFEDESPWLYADLPVETVGYSGYNDSSVNWDYILIGPGGASEGLWKHNVGDPGVFYDSSASQDSYLTLIINPSGNTVFYFDNLDLRTESTNNGVDIPDDIFYVMEASNTYQEISRNLEFTLNQNQHSGTIKRIGRIWRTPVMPTTSNARMVDTYLKVTLKYDNSLGNKFKVHDVISYIRPAKH